MNKKVALVCPACFQDNPYWDIAIILMTHDGKTLQGCRHLRLIEVEDEKR